MRGVVKRFRISDHGNVSGSGMVQISSHPNHGLKSEQVLVWILNHGLDFEQWPGSKSEPGRVWILDDSVFRVFGFWTRTEFSFLTSKLLLCQIKSQIARLFSHKIIGCENLHTRRHWNVIPGLDQPQHDRLNPELGSSSKNFVELDAKKSCNF